MIYTIGTYKIDIPEIISTAGRPRTPRQVVPWRDVAETCRTLDAVCSKIPSGRRPLKIVDGIARAGFWGAIFKERWPNCDLLLNEEDQECADMLRDNFADDIKIESHSLADWVPEVSDLILLDFDAFTLKKLGEHQGILERLSPACKYMIIAESACFGFKFGNIKHYGVETEEEYYALVDAQLYPVTGKSVLAVSKFCNAAMVLLGPDNGQEIEYIQPTGLPVFRGGKPFIGDLERSQKATKINEGFGL